MSKVAFVTYGELPELSEDDRLAVASLRSAGVETEAVVWDSPTVHWEQFDLVVLRSCWEYHLRTAEFLDWLSRMTRMGANLWNPPQVVLGNIEKVYLRGLAARGAKIAPTKWIDKGAEIDLPSILREHGWARAVVKPTISMSSHDTWITSPERAAADGPTAAEVVKRSGLMVQQFAEEVCTRGEWSFVFFEKRYSHAVLKRPKSGDFRVQRDYGGHVERNAVPSPSLVSEAERIVNMIEEPLLFARVDGVDVNGTLMLMELELIDPVLFFGSDPLAGKRFADAIRLKLPAKSYP